ncbi:MAG: tetratricopeptide repeat protein [Terriglobales bacterium]
MSQRTPLLPRLFFVALFCLTSSHAYSIDSRAALQNAADLVQQGRLDDADRQAHIALADPQTRAAACSVLGTIRLQQQRIPESVNFLQEAIRLEPRLVGARLSLAEAYTAQGKQAPAIAMYRRVLELDSSNALARFALARYESEKGNYRQSLELVTPISAELKKSPDGLLLLANAYIKVGDRAEAGELSKDWIHLSDVPLDWSIRFALVLANGGQTNQAIDVLENAARSGVPSYELAFNLAGLYLLNGNPTLALDQYDQALRAKPDSVPALRQAAITAEKENHFERSLSYWQRAKKIEPDDPDILLGFGRVCLKMDLLDDAENALTKAAGLRPDDAAYLYALGSAKVGKKEFEAAQAIFEKLVKQSPQDSQVQYALGSVLYLEGHLADASAHFNESVRLQPNQLASYYYLALIARDQGKESEAIQKLETLLQQYPDHAPSHEVLGELLMGAKQYPEAQSNLERAVRLDPKSVKANYQLGLLLSRMGKKEDADKQLEVAKSLRTEDQASRLQLRLLDPDQ